MIYLELMKHLLARLILLAVLAVGFAFFLLSRSQESETIHGVDVSDLDRVPSAISYTNADENLIVVTSPLPGETISSPITIAGIARGTWYFEATAPVTLVNWDGLIIAEGYVTATENWMTEEFVPFEGTLEFESPSVYPRGALILRNSNASGLPEYDRAVEIPILFD